MLVVFYHECPSRFQLQLQGEGTYQKKLNVKTFPFSSSNRETQRCNSRKSHLSKLLSLVKKQLQRYDIRDALIGKRYLREKLISNSESKVHVSLEMVKLLFAEVYFSPHLALTNHLCSFPQH